MKTSDIHITREWLEARCTQEDEHLLWKLNCHGGGPRGYMGEGQFSVRVAAWAMYHGSHPPAGKTARPCCDDERCLSKKCLKLVPHGGYNRGKTRSIATRKKNAEALRALKGLRPEVVEAIRVSDKPAKVIAAELGVKLHAVHDIQGGRRWVDFGNPFTQLMAR